MKHALLAISASALLLSILACSGASKADPPLQSPEQALISMYGDWSGPMKLNAIDQSVDMNVNIDGQTLTMRGADDPDGAPTTLSLVVTHEGGKPTLDLVFVNPDGAESKQLCSYNLASDWQTLQICCGTAPGAPRPASAKPCDAKSDMSLSLVKSAAAPNNATADSGPATLANTDAAGGQALLQGEWRGVMSMATPQMSEELSASISGDVMTLTSAAGEELSQRMTLGASEDGVSVPVDLVSDAGTQRCAAVGTAAAIMLCCTLDEEASRPAATPCDAEGQYTLSLSRPE
jgi:hypothetical protein